MTRRESKERKKREGLGREGLAREMINEGSWVGRDHIIVKSRGTFNNNDEDKKSSAQKETKDTQKRHKRKQIRVMMITQSCKHPGRVRHANLPTGHRQKFFETPISFHDQSFARVFYFKLHTEFSIGFDIHLQPVEIQ